MRATKTETRVLISRHSLLWAREGDIRQLFSGEVKEIVCFRSADGPNPTRRFTITSVDISLTTKTGHDLEQEIKARLREVEIPVMTGSSGSLRGGVNHGGASAGSMDPLYM